MLTMASMVEKESGRPDEQLGLVASVFFNRLDSPDFRPCAGAAIGSDGRLRVSRRADTRTRARRMRGE